MGNFWEATPAMGTVGGGPPAELAKPALALLRFSPHAQVHICCRAPKSSGFLGQTFAHPVKNK